MNFFFKLFILCLFPYVDAVVKKKAAPEKGEQNKTLSEAPKRSLRLSEAPKPSKDKVEKGINMSLFV